MDSTSLDDIAWWIKQVTDARSGVRFDGPDFFRPYHFAVLAGELARRGSGVTGLSVDGPLEGYAARMHLWQAIDLTPPKEVLERNPGGRFHPLTSIRSEQDAENAADAIRQVFRTCGTTDQTTLEAIFTMLVEIIGNCFFHSETGTQIRGLVCAQSWPHANLAQVAVIDIGVGVRRSLGQNPAYAERLLQENACALATELGITSKPGRGHAGYGLALARQLFEDQGGDFMLLSNNEAFLVRGGEPEARSMPQSWTGTLAIMEWRIDHAFDVAQVYRKWPGDSENDYV